MAIRLKPRKSFKQNTRDILPELLDRFLSFQDRIVGQPQHKKELHDMRIAGKPLRYLMEASRRGFGKEFRICLEEIEYTLEVMGTIHDCDVAQAVLIEYHGEVKIFNRRAKKGTTRFSLRVVEDMLYRQEVKRDKFFRRLCSILEQWKNKDFEAKLLQSMK